MALGEDLRVFFDDFSAVPVAAYGVNGYGILDSTGEYIGPDDGRDSDEYAIRCLFAEFGSLLYGDAITVDSAPFKVRGNLPIDDGKFCLILLTKLEGAVALGRLMLEDGGYLLLEDGGFILLEV
jgi:hypothetical protein